ncbi:unnamed protein product [Rotaria magnacalcarata]|uniref:F-box domain-containing protein n=2 Tax=Rotaria magnacalcarata TaxID=392030 RepID=A0A816STX5_9BILA|nr:unnamed protein product [Rotaria magnacalcarata]CAF1644202.1 unnamed protein product [Rotaria magnacalcarata]CAF2066321.1 unnamed protein product [Rotaria magnacalcarata]CAF2087752.1 unnamed protein product [Rotaria magnacalcarata]CAF2151786.1 unnamed protein product [Rotaria magnacalcarata]
MTLFENLPNEVLYEIFDFLNLCHAFDAFFNLNTRFQHLLINSPLHLKIDFSYISKLTFQHCCTYIIQPNIHRVLSLRLLNPLAIDFFHSLLSFNASFSQLESLIFTQINFKKLEPTLSSLSSLPRLYSLTINNNIEVCDSSEIYRLIFHLPVLKNCIISPKFYGGNLTLHAATNEHSPIEHLSINRHCSLNQFISLISYTPKLSHLSSLSISEPSNTRMNIISIVYPKLTHISLKLWRMSFDSFELLCSKLFSHLEFLSICTRADDHYLMAHRWQQLIMNYMPNLRIFDFQHYWEPVDDNNTEQRTYHRLIDCFTSSFWINREWFFAHQHFSRRGIRDAVFYSTHPYRRNLYELHERAHNDACPRREKGKNLARRVNIDDYRAATNCSLQFPYANELSLWGRGAKGNFSFLADLSHMFNFSKLTHFSVQCPDFGLSQLIELLKHLPNIHSLMLYANTSYLSSEQVQPVCFLSNENRITNVTIRGRCTIQQVHLLMNFCPRVKCLEIEIDEDQLESVVRFLLLGKTIHMQIDSPKSKTLLLREFDSLQRKFLYLFSRSPNKKLNPSDDLSTSMLNQHSCNSNLFSICFFNPKSGMEQKLQRMISREKLLNDYSIGSVFNYLYLWW